MSKYVNVGFVGYGYWGPNLVRNLLKVQDAKLQYICDLDSHKLSRLKKEHQDLEITNNYNVLLEDRNVDAIVIATPPSTHFKLAKEALIYEKHVLVEKPLALNSAECKELIELSKKYKKVLMVGHTFEYNAAVNKVKEYIESKELGKIYYIYSQRLNLGRLRQDVNAMWNFAPHDISIILYWLNRAPISVSARGFTYLQKGIEDVVFMILNFSENISAHIHISWLDPNKVRMMTIVGSDKMVIYDDVSTSSKIKIFEKGFIKKHKIDSFGNFKSFAEFQLIQRGGNLVIPKIDFIEPLEIECKHFIECIKDGKEPLTDGYDGLRVVKTLEAAQISLVNGGEIVKVK